jgi:bifunctional DNA-binding transcriptional regulator/antitoxin component of YhaV-PrlF toxin-antitoxin module
LIKKNILLLKEKEKLESIINEKGIYLNRLVTKEELDELKTLQKEYKELSSL